MAPFRSACRSGVRSLHPLRSLAGVAAVLALAAPLATVIRWSDGDAVVTNRGKARLIGVDTPETGACGASAAKRRAERIAPPGSAVRLVDPRSVRNKDRYGRLLRYAQRAARDVGMAQIRGGARARYDSRTGCDHHPRQAAYIRADRAHGSSCGSAGGSGGEAAGGGGGAYAPTNGGRDCPTRAPIKGNRGSNGWIYHLPSNRYYGVTNPEECFATEVAAQRAGYRAAKV